MRADFFSAVVKNNRDSGKSGESSSKGVSNQNQNFNQNQKVHNRPVYVPDNLLVMNFVFALAGFF